MLPRSASESKSINSNPDRSAEPLLLPANAESLKPLEVVLPDAIITPVVEATYRVVERFRTEPHPDKLVVLDRSARLPSIPTVMRIAQEYGDKAVQYLPVGKVLPLMFCSFMEANGHPEYDEGVWQHNDGDILLFAWWLRNSNDPTIQILLDDIKENGLNDGRLVVVDDAESSGETIEFSLPGVLLAAMDLPELDTDTVPSQGFGALDEKALIADIRERMDIVQVFPRSVEWEDLLIDNLKIALSPAERVAFKTMMKGTVDLRRVGEEIVNYKDMIPEERLPVITTWLENQKEAGIALADLEDPIAVELTGYEALYNAKFKAEMSGKSREVVADDPEYSTNPALRLIQKPPFAHGGYQRFRGDLREAFQQIDISVKNLN